MASGIMVAGEWIADRKVTDQIGQFHEIPTDRKSVV